MSDPPSSAGHFLAAVVQLNCTSDAEGNWTQAEGLVVRAAQRGTSLVVTPENANYLGPHCRKVELAEPLDGPTCRRWADLARRLEVHLLLGSFNERSPDPTRCYNTSVLFSPTGKVLASYRKIHLFDVDVPPDVVFRESETVLAGEDIVVADTALGKIGLTICYDLRFGELYRRLVVAGAEIVTIPSAFTATTGKDHWHALVRARAIECQAWVLAPGQVGRHDDDGLRQSYGHSLIVDPWGQEVAMVPDGPGLAFAEIDLERVRRVRRLMPLDRRLPVG